MNTRILLVILFASLLSCQNKSEKRSEQSLQVIFPVTMQESPDEKSRVIRKLQKGTILEDLNQVSTFISSLYLNDTLLHEPWVYVKHSAEEKGWVFAGALNTIDPQKQRAWMLAKRFEAWFGPQLCKRWQAWGRQQQVETDSAFALLVREGLSLRDTINLLVTRRVIRDPNQAQYELFWLAETMPYFIVQQMDNGTAYKLFMDYRKVQQTARQTIGKQDDISAEAFLAAFPADSIESALPAWVFPLTTEESYSNLGSGNHLSVLKLIDKGILTGSAFHPELNDLKDLLLDDILNGNRKYWQAKDEILAEIDAILSADLECLSKRDKLALNARRNMFEHSDEQNLIINLRSGE